MAMRKTTIILLGCAALLCGGVQAQTDGLQRIVDDGAIVPARIGLECLRTAAPEYKRFCDRMLMDADWAAWLSSAQTGLPARDIVTALRRYMKEYPDAPHQNRLKAMLAEAYFACGDCVAMTEMMDDIDVEALPADELERLVVTYGMALSTLGQMDEARVQLRTAQLLGGKYSDEAAFALAWTDYADGRLDEADEEFTAVENVPALRDAALFYKAEVALEKGDYQTALERSNSNSLFSTELKRVRGEALFGLGRYVESALQLEEWLAETDEPSREALFRLGLAHYNSGEYLRAPEVLAMVDKAGTADDAVAQCAELYSGLSYLKSGDVARARMSFERASAMTADDALRQQAMYNHIAALHESGGGAFGEGVTVAERFLNEYPTSAWSPKVGAYLAETYLSTRNYEAALQSIAKINHPDAALMEARQKLLCRAGSEAFAGGDTDKAIDLLSQCIAMAGYDKRVRAEALLWRGEAHYRQGNYSGARKDYSGSLTLDDTGRTALLARYGLAYCYFRQGNYNEAYRQFDRFFATQGVATETDNATRADVWGRMGDCLFQARRYSDAASAYDKAMSIDPESGDYAIYQKAFSQGLLGRYKDKVSTLDQLLRHFPTSDYADDALFEKGRSLVQLEQWEGALSAFRQLLERYPRCSYAPSAGNEIALLYYQTGRTAEAEAAYKHVITTYPGSEEASVAMRDLKSLYVEENKVDSYVQFASQAKGMVAVEVTEHDSLTYAAAEQLYMRGETKKAQDALDRYLQQFPAGAYAVNAHYHLGCILRDQKNYDSAISHLRKVAEMRGNRYQEEATRLVGDMAYDHKDYALALQAYKDLKAMTSRPDVRLHAQTFGVRAAWALSDWDTVISEVGTFVQASGLAPETAIEMRYYRAKACLARRQNDTAKADLTVLAKDTRSVYGAEAKYLLAQLYFDTAQAENAEKEVLDYINVSTPHTYWLARSFILLADVYLASGRDVEARQYLLSLRQNYDAKDDIAERIEERLAKLQ
jgi:tetratricopeptide (TPR) repeat protein